MRYTLTFMDTHYEQLQNLLSDEDGENAAYLICHQSKTDNECRLLVQTVLSIPAEHILERSKRHLKIASASYLSAIKRAHNDKGSFIFVHSHPNELAVHSAQDNEEESALFKTAYNRIHNVESIHASLIFHEGKISAARVWLPDGSTKPIERLRIIGDRFRFSFFDALKVEKTYEFFDRQVRAFGSDLQPLLSRLKIAVVGAGGTGSSIIEQLTRLGVGSLTIIDGDTFDKSNINRLYGSHVKDEGLPKVTLAKRNVSQIGLETIAETMAKPITYQSAMLKLKECDLVFGCTDDDWGRAILTRLAIYYLIPVFDMGVKIDSKDFKIHSIDGRVTTLMPGAPCLFCRGRITAEAVRQQSIRDTNPEEAVKLEAEGYIPELAEPAPAVIPFTTTVASAAIMEFMHRLTGFMGEDRTGFETLLMLDRSTIRRISKPRDEKCFCAQNKFWGRGDVKPLLDSTWRTE